MRLSMLWSFCAFLLLATGCAGRNDALAPALTPQIHAAGAYAVIHVFSGGKGGSFPNAPVLVKGGTIFGTTATGGNNKGNCANYFCGTVFSIKPSGQKFSVLYAFLGGTAGSGPYTKLVDAQGALYGSSLGGAVPPYNGQIYKLSGKARLQRTTVRSFIGGKDGDDPSALLLDANGTTFFGTTASSSGGDCCGTVFQINSDGSGYRVLHYFAQFPNGLPGPDGGHPSGALVEDPATGTLYGVALVGGKIDAVLCQEGCGTVYELVPRGGGKYKFSVIYRFQGDKDGFNPVDRLALGPSTAKNPPPIYGATANGGPDQVCSFNGQLTGCGTVYKLTASGSKFTESILYSFAGSEENDGQSPSTGVTLVGSTLYGTTTIGGAGSALGHLGTVFSVSTEGAGYRIIHSFQGGNDGTFPSGSLTYSGGTLFGVTSEGGSSKQCTDGYPGCGTIYAIGVH